LTAIFAALFLATLFLLMRNKSSSNSYNSTTPIQQSVNQTHTPPQQPYVGQSTSPGQFCIKCGAALQPGVRFCNRCGSQQ
jgi:ribosomal protein L40E